MAAKRFFNESSSDTDQPADKRIKTRTSFASVIGEVVLVKSLQNLCSSLEPLFRRVVNEELESSLIRHSRSFTRSPSLRIEALDPSSFQLKFSKNLSLPIFTGSKILDTENAALQLLLVDTRSDQTVPVTFPSPIKVEIVVLDGDFPPNDRDSWSHGEFDRKIVRERAGKRPLLTGDALVITMRDGIAMIGDIEFTDNSSWIRSRRFRLGAKVNRESSPGVKIREAITESFIVRDHRGEVYQKHHPPMLDDEVWRLEKIGRFGAFHRRLVDSGGIYTVQDFLKLSIVDPVKLRKILGHGMSDRTWEATIKHARTCIMGNKNYIFRRPNCIIFMTPICEVFKAMINGQMYLYRELNCINRDYIDSLVREAYENWSSLEEVDENDIALLPQGDMADHQCPNHQHQTLAISVQQNLYLTDNSYMYSSGGRLMNPTYIGEPADSGGAAGYNFFEPSSDDDLIP